MSNLEEMFELIGRLVGILAEALAEDDSSFVQEHVPLHGFQAQLPQPIPLAFGPHAETCLQQEPAQFGQTRLAVKEKYANQCQEWPKSCIRFE